MKQLFTSKQSTKKRYFPERMSMLYAFKRGSVLLADFMKVFVLLLLIIPFSNSYAQSVITGKVTDAASGEAIAGVDVQIEESGETTSADIDGRFLFRRVSPGDYTLVVQSTGYERQEVEVQVEGSEDTVQDIELTRISPDGDELFVTRHRSRQAQAINRSEPFNPIISSGQIERFGDYSVEDALRRMPGIQAARNGNINIRGVGQDHYYITVDGQRLASTGSGTRSVDPGVFSTDLIRELEVINVIRPDMDADGLAGAVNIVTRHPVGGERELNVIAGGGTNTEYYDNLDPASRFSLKYVEPLLDELTLVVGVQRQVEQQAWESLAVDYDVADFGSGPVDVIESLSQGLNTDERGRWGGQLQLTYEPDNRSRFHVRAMLNSENRRLVGHQNSWVANGNWDDQTTTGSLGRFEYDLNLRDVDTQHYTVQAGGRHLFDLMNLEYNVGWAYGSKNSAYYRLPFQDTGIQHTIDMNDRSRPEMEMVDTPFDAGSMFLQSMDYIVDNHIDNRFTGRIDAEFPFSFGSFKVGSSIISTSKDAFEEGAYSEYLYTYRGNLTLNGFEMRDENPSNIVEDQYPMPWMVDAESARNFFDTNIPNMLLDQEEFHNQSDHWNYETMENIYGSYGMATFELGNLILSGGVRMEYTDSEHSGRVVEFNQFDRYEETSDTTESVNHTDIFPNAILSYNITQQSNVSLAYSNTISRPDFNLLAPFEQVKAADTTLFRGNPELDPVYSDNIDFYYKQGFTNVGALSVGLFYKEISNFIFVESQPIQIEEGDVAMMDPLFTEEENVIEAEEIKYRNSSETATLYGAQVSWQQSLMFLPDYLGDIGTYLNYTWTHSEFDTGRDDDVDLPGQSPHVVNAALQYSRGRLSAQLSYHWTDTALRDLRENRTLAPSINNQEEVYMDQYEDGWQDLSLTLRFRITDNFRFWTDIQNLLNDEQMRYAHTRNQYPVHTQLREGTNFRLGIRFDL